MSPAHTDREMRRRCCLSGCAPACDRSPYPATNPGHSHWIACRMFWTIHRARAAAAPKIVGNRAERTPTAFPGPGTTQSGKIDIAMPPTPTPVSIGIALPGGVQRWMDHRAGGRPFTVHWVTKTTVAVYLQGAMLFEFCHHQHYDLLLNWHSPKYPFINYFFPIAYGVI